MTARLVTLDSSHARQVGEFLDRSPTENLFLSAKIHDLGIDRRRLGKFFGFTRDGELTALCMDGGTLFVTGDDLDAIPHFVKEVGSFRRCTSILGPSKPTLAMLVALSERWPRSWADWSNVRQSQPVMALNQPPQVPGDPRVQRLTESVFHSYLKASEDMYTEEIGSSPYKYGGGYEHFVRQRLINGDAWGIVENGEVIFKADIGPRVPNQAQLQGVWVHPAFRGRGISEPALAAMLTDALRIYPQISLYVNDFNIPALRAYERLGFVRTGTLSTVHY